MKKIIFILAVIFCLSFLTGCNEEEKEQNITVKYVTEYKVTDDDVEILDFVEKNVPTGHLSFPEEVLGENDEFKNAYYIKEGESEFSSWDFEEDITDEDIVIYLEIIRKFKVSFLDNNLNPISVKIIEKGGYANQIGINNENYKVVNWFFDKELTTPVEFPFLVTHDYVLYPEVINKYSLTYLDRDGEVVKSEKYFENEQIDNFTIEEDEYKVLEWYYDAELTEPVTFPFYLNGDTTLYPKVTEKHTLTYLDKDGNTAKEEKYFSDEMITGYALETEKYGVEGWYYDAELTEPVTFPLYISGDTTLYPKVLDKYTITYLNMDGNKYTTKTVYENQIIPNVESYAINYRILGWYYDSEFTTKLEEGDIASEDLTLYGEFEYAHKISFDSFGGSSVSDVYVYDDQEVTSSMIKEPTKNKCIFKGWYYDSDLTVEFIPSEATITEDITLYAKWMEPKYREDTREAKYILWSNTDEEVARYTSLYAAINASVDSGVINSYVTALDSSEKLFSNDEYFSPNSADMFWYYSDVTTKSRYTLWEATYWNDVKNTNEICVFKNSMTGQLEPYANGHSIIKMGTQSDATEDQVWSYCLFLETNAIVNVGKYSGITEQSYTVALSEARIYPNYQGTDQVYAYVGFNTADDYHSSHMGLRCDVNTGNWYYYCGQAVYNDNAIEVDDSECIVTSTWNEELGCFIPDEDITMKVELLINEDYDGILHRLIIVKEDGTKVVRDYELNSLTLCSTIRFTCGMDIEATKFPDYMCGAKFENVVVTSAKGIVYQEMINNEEVYGKVATITTAGEYDLLNSNPASIARYQTLIYTPACVSYNFETPGRDVYSFSFDF